MMTIKLCPVVFVYVADIVIFELHFQRFNTGAVSIAWQEEMLETKVFDDLNVFLPDGGLPTDLDFNFIPEPEPKGCFPFLRKKFKVLNRQNVHKLKWLNLNVLLFMYNLSILCLHNFRRREVITCMICVRTRTLSQAVPPTLPASLALTHVYFPRSVERTFAINKLPSSRI